MPACEFHLDTCGFSVLQKEDSFGKVIFVDSFCSFLCFGPPLFGDLPGKNFVSLYINVVEVTFKLIKFYMVKD